MEFAVFLYVLRCWVVFGCFSIILPIGRINQNVKIAREGARMPLKVEKVIKYCFRGSDLVKAREAVGMTQEELAKNVDFWSQPRICEIESQEIHHSISKENLEKLNAVFDSHSIL
jgi:ribosome-binding protein aMBF1 (putative translation factor)